jgi:hypothetical protein
MEVVSRRVGIVGLHIDDQIIRMRADVANTRSQRFSQLALNCGRPIQSIPERGTIPDSLFFSLGAQGFARIYPRRAPCGQEARDQRRNA